MSDPAHPSAPLRPSLLILLAVAAGASVANSYYNQAMLGHLVRDFALTGAAVAAIPVLTQFGNALGVLLLAPLGDRVERRRLILMTLSLLVVALLAAAAAPSFTVLIIASFAIGSFATVAQQIVPLAVHIAPPNERGSVLGKVTGGILIGILLARTASGVISDVWSWRIAFFFSAGLMMLIGVLLAWRLPKVRPTTDLSYFGLIASLGQLVRAHRALRRATLMQSLLFAAFIGFWSTLALELQSPHYGLGSTSVGLLALIGVAGAMAAPLAGRLADRKGARNVAAIGALLVAATFALLGAFQGSVAVLVVGTLGLDLAIQSSQIANQTVVYAIDPAARSRLNTIFMAAMLLSGAVGAAISGAAHTQWGWTGVCVFGGASALLASALAIRRP